MLSWRPFFLIVYYNINQFKFHFPSVLFMHLKILQSEVQRNQKEVVLRDSLLEILQ